MECAQGAPPLHEVQRLVLWSPLLVVLLELLPYNTTYKVLIALLPIDIYLREQPDRVLAAGHANLVPPSWSHEEQGQHAGAEAKCPHFILFEHFLTACALQGAMP